SVAGCDLVIPGGDLPPVLCVIARTAEGPRLRKLAPNFKLNLNDNAVHHGPLTNGDQIEIGDAQIIVHVPTMAKVPAAAGTAAPGKLLSYVIPIASPDPRKLDTSGSLRQMQQEADRLKQQARELEARRKALDDEETSRRQTWTERESQLEAELEEAR